MSPQPTQLPLEVAVFSGANAIQAQNQGAHRVELNAPGSYLRGGLTPPVDELTSVSPWLKIPLRIMIRPVGAPLESTTGRGRGDFMYIPAEFDAMKRSIAAFKATGAMDVLRGDGFVFGILTTAPTEHTERDARARVRVDVPRCTELVKLASPFPCVFHRAFDPIADTELLHQGLRDLSACGFDGLLTAGGAGPSHEAHLQRLDGMAFYIEMHRELRDLQLVVGGGVRAHNADRAVAKLGTHKHGRVWLHSACLARNPAGGGAAGENVDDVELRNLISRLELARVD
ncbi:Copper homeostasis protein-like protein [Hapsidospora chrysogenum ATCC 11550]|uniref:Copper homeostasis protein cutC homolog n=1 Tax=Hapsidospora chrysogenum (strain ATCC 11550 / CBS 779.69 / DSM 880 / IAM 14645 / JCM 23072 / IMI 49137) TaxID=857340 RepID=A0A086SW12_HAPC1|nr:Copper homeostasis protein-like protein [Hapsidospora chrysogenum ATCC 11550]